MRLLNCRSKSLEAFPKDIPKYAILSHTWDKEEVVFCDFKDINLDHICMKGWYKVERSCEQAIQDGLDYIWIDTLCIDKSSSAELSEAINSMFQWYRNSSLCYAYLYDLPSLAFEESRWFTRGWTLQEMIAPKEIKFYDRNWEFRGTKSALIRQLHDITSVDRSILLGGSLRLISIARRLSWAAKRETTRVEDMAYCLLGLFDISMPMLYGEGHNAFRRLQEEIVKEYDDHSLFAWKNTASSEYTGLFAKSPADFVDSANIVPTLGRGSEPTVVTNRGVRITARLAKSEEEFQDDSTVFAVLNCRSIDFDMKARKRIAIALRVNYDSGAISSYIRLRSGYLYSEMSFQEERKSLYILKDNYLDDLRDSCIFILRTVPNQKQFELVRAHPREQWEEKNTLFRVKRLVCSITQFVLVFRQVCLGSDATTLGHFAVFLRLLSPRNSTNVDSSPTLQSDVEPSCKVRFYPCSDLEELDLERAAKEGLWSPDSCEDGTGMTMKCYVSKVVISGQDVYTVDLNAKEIE
ncbi:hypothetical protein O1611_g2863 [Lasiodiplodia mahajangana]|uniref:Uncharacterized protein n=1 Tax=Lasiodiplodia mahajangana TaxID=1108764 RepID=A0ACC2JTF0_9PEZI|nr:hypothetical protein O1611_g2863 [Lasiodiplodia mahajangana]